MVGEGAPGRPACPGTGGACVPEPTGQGWAQAVRPARARPGGRRAEGRRQADGLTRPVLLSTGGLVGAQHGAKDVSRMSRGGLGSGVGVPFSAPGEGRVSWLQKLPAGLALASIPGLGLLSSGRVPCGLSHCCEL